jgi:Cysteine-rich CPXCG
MPEDAEDFDEEMEDWSPDEAATVECPYCGEEVEILLDPGGGMSQEYIEDCEVCCRPLSIHVHYDEDGNARVDAQASDD